MPAPIPGGPGWQMNGDTLRAEVTDLSMFLAAHADDPFLDVVVALFQSEPGAARAALDPILTKAPADIRLLALEADVWRDEGRFDEASDRYRRLIWGTSRPSLLATLTQHLGKVHFAARQFGDAAECFERAIALRVDNGASVDLVESSRRALERANEEQRAGS